MAAAILASCAHAISEETRKSARKDVSFGEVVKDPFMYEGSLFIWGGVIVKTKITESGSMMEVRQAPLDAYGNIRNPDVSQGRFLVRADKHLDPLIFEDGREVTVAGVLTGTAKGHIGDAEYVFPVLEAREIVLVREEEYYYYGPYGPYDPWLFGPPYYNDPWFYGRPHRHHRHWDGHKDWHGH